MSKAARTHTPKKGKEDSIVFLAKIKNGLRFHVNDHLSLRKAAVKAGISRNTLAKYLHKFDVESTRDIRDVTPVVQGIFYQHFQILIINQIS